MFAVTGSREEKNWSKGKEGLIQNATNKSRQQSFKLVTSMFFGQLTVVQLHMFKINNLKIIKSSDISILYTESLKGGI